MNRVKHCVCIAMAFTAFTGTVYAIAALLAPDQTLQTADVVAYVRVTATTPPPEPMIEYEDSGAVTFRRAPALIGKYSRIATAKVIAAVKGCENGQILKLDFDNGLTCPNVFYEDD